MTNRYDAVIVGSGPNGLVAANRLAGAGRSVLVVEAADEPGGGLRTVELMEPGFYNDVCSTVQALVPLSPAMSRLDVDLVVPPAAIAHPFDDGTAVLLRQSVTETAMQLGKDQKRYARLMGRYVQNARPLFDEILRPVIHVPRHPLLLARFGLPGMLSAVRLSRLLFREERARALFAGAAAHSMLSLHEAVTASYGLAMLISAHVGGWPFARGGSKSVAEALIVDLQAAGGELQLGRRISSLAGIPEAKAVVLDLVPEGILAVAGEGLSSGYKKQLQRYRYGPGAFKLDWTLNGPIPWLPADCGQAGTVHLGGTAEEIAFAEHEVAQGRHPAKPFVLLTQPSLFDSTRAPAGKHVAWAYCHVPNGSDLDMTNAIESQIERFAPGFRDLIRERFVWTPTKLQSNELNCIGGDVNGGRQDLRQLIFRPVVRFNPYTTSNPSIFISSSATPPGGGVHGMCGWHAAGEVLKRLG